MVEPVFFSPHSTIAAGQGSGVVLVTGSSGGGKTFLCFLLATQWALSGCHTLFIDPKGDSLPLQYLPELRNHVTVWDLKEGESGILDPFSLADDQDEQLLMALETINLLIGKDAANRYQALIAQAINAVIQQPEPSLYKVMDYLKVVGENNLEAFNLHSLLSIAARMEFSRLFFNADTSNSTSLDRKGLTIVTLQGLSLPPAEISREEYDTPQKIGVAVMFLLASYTRRIMFNTSTRRQPKAIIIDEAWTILGTPSGTKIIEETTRLGRSLNTALVCISQNSEDYEKSGIRNSIPNRIAFKAKAEDAKSVLETLELDPNSKQNVSLLNNLELGNAVMRDAYGRISRFKVHCPNEVWREFFNTNPDSMRPIEELKAISDQYIKQYL